MDRPLHTGLAFSYISHESKLLIFAAMLEALWDFLLQLET